MTNPIKNYGSSIRSDSTQNPPAQEQRNPPNAPASAHSLITQVAALQITASQHSVAGGCSSSSSSSSLPRESSHSSEVQKAAQAIIPKKADPAPDMCLYCWENCPSLNLQNTQVNSLQSLNPQIALKAILEEIIVQRFNQQRGRLSHSVPNPEWIYEWIVQHENKITDAQTLSEILILLKYLVLGNYLQTPSEKEMETLYGLATNLCRKGHRVLNPLPALQVITSLAERSKQPLISSSLCSHFIDYLLSENEKDNLDSSIFLLIGQLLKYHQIDRLTPKQLERWVDLYFNEAKNFEPDWEEYLTRRGWGEYLLVPGILDHLLCRGNLPDTARILHCMYVLGYANSCYTYEEGCSNESKSKLIALCRRLLLEQPHADSITLVNQMLQAISLYTSLFNEHPSEELAIINELLKKAFVICPLDERPSLITKVMKDLEVLEDPLAEIPCLNEQLALFFQEGLPPLKLVKILHYDIAYDFCSNPDHSEAAKALESQLLKALETIPTLIDPQTYPSTQLIAMAFALAGHAARIFQTDTQHINQTFQTLVTKLCPDRHVVPNLTFNKAVSFLLERAHLDLTALETSWILKGLAELGLNKNVTALTDIEISEVLGHILEEFSQVARFEDKSSQDEIPNVLDAFYLLTILKLIPTPIRNIQMSIDVMLDIVQQPYCKHFKLHQLEKIVTSLGELATRQMKPSDVSATHLVANCRKHILTEVPLTKSTKFLRGICLLFQEGLVSNEEQNLWKRSIQRLIGNAIDTEDLDDGTAEQICNFVKAFPQMMEESDLPPDAGPELTSEEIQQCQEVIQKCQDHLQNSKKKKEKS